MAAIVAADKTQRASRVWVLGRPTIKVGEPSASLLRRSDSWRYIYLHIRVINQAGFLLAPLEVGVRSGNQGWVRHMDCKQRGAVTTPLTSYIDKASKVSYSRCARTEWP